MKNIVITFFIIICFTMVQAQNSSGREYNLLIGTYTNADRTNGIYVYSFDTHTAEFNEKNKFTEITNASYLAISRDRKNVFSVSESGQGNGMVNAYSFDLTTGDLRFMNGVSTGGDYPCYVSVDDKKKYVFVGNYGGGSLLAIRLNANGSFSSEAQAIQHEGSSANKSRQDKPHVHAVVLSPDNKYLLVPDLGTDKVNIYRFDPTKPQPLLTAGFTSLTPGSGPRHLTFHPNGKFAYLILELEAKVTAFDYKDGKLQAKQTITMIADDFKGNVSAADIHVSPDGKFLYGSNRADANEIVIYSINKKGLLTFVGRQSVLGKTPRNFVIDPSGNFLLVANQNTNEVIIFKRDQKTGMLTPTEKKILVDKPVCLKFAAIE